MTDERKKSYVIELIVGGKVVYRLETTTPRNDDVELKQYIADSLTGKKLEALREEQQ